MKTTHLQQPSKMLLRVLILGSALLWACETDYDVNTPGNLVPLTVEQDPSIPAIEVNGTRLHAEAFGNPSDPMVVFLHGGPGCDYRNALNVKGLTGDGYYVVFYDQRGAGLSARQNFGTYTIRQYVDDLTGVITHYRSSASQKVFLFGHSWGAMLAVAYINEYPNAIDGVIFAEPGGFTDEVAREYGSAIHALNLFSEGTNDALYYEQFLTGKENDHEMLDYRLALASSINYADGNEEGVEGPSPFWRVGAVVYNSFQKLADDDGFDFTAHLDQYETKVLFLYSELNKAYGPAMAQKVSSYFHDAEITRIDGTGHEMIYFKWDAVHPVVLNYLNSLK